MRAPEPGDACLPGGRCPTCNPVYWCQGCGDVRVEERRDLCPACTRYAIAAAREEEEESCDEP